MGKAGGAKNKQGKGGGRVRHPYANEYGGARVRYRDSDRNTLPEAMLDPEVGQDRINERLEHAGTHATASAGPKVAINSSRSSGMDDAKRMRS